MTTRRIYVDFDGVFNVNRHRKSDPWIESTGWNTHEKEILSAGGRWVIHYSPDLVEEFNKLHERGVEIVWISTWQQYTRAFDALGFKSRHQWLQISHDDNFNALDDEDTFRVNLFDDAREVRALFQKDMFWYAKGSVLFSHLRKFPVDRAVWFDDQISFNCFDYAHSEGFDKFLKIVKTNENAGISPAMLDDAVEFLFS